MKGKFVFSGNRTSVLEFMINKGLEIESIIVVNNSYLHHFVLNNEITNFIIIENKKHLIEQIEKLDFDYFVANGLPYILPIEKLKEGNNKRFINVHPSYLPDLKGADPVPGAILYGRDSGATCHEMDAGIDTGNILAQYKIPYHINYDVGLLYKLCFKAEEKVFEMALENEFLSSSAQTSIEDEIFYSFKIEDTLADKNESAKALIRRIRAFSNPSKGVEIDIDGVKLKVFSADIIPNNAVELLFKSDENRALIFDYEDKKLIKWNGSYLKLTKYKLFNEE